MSTTISPHEYAHDSSGRPGAGAPAHGPRSTIAADGPGSRAGELSGMLAVVLVGLSAGFFVAYVSSVTRGLADVGDLAYVETFQAINESVRNPLFGIVFFGSLPALGAAIICNWRRASTLKRALLVTALTCYVAVIAITGTGNVPLNRALAEVDGSDPAAAAQARTDFEHEWNRHNRNRTVASVGAFVAVSAAMQVADPSKPRSPA